MAITCPTTQVVCDGNGEVSVQDIVDNVNQLIDACNEAKVCCDKYSVGDVIRVHKVDNIMYMTNDGSDPTPSNPAP